MSDRQIEIADGRRQRGEFTTARAIRILGQTVTRAWNPFDIAKALRDGASLRQIEDELDRKETR